MALAEKGAMTTTAGSRPSARFFCLRRDGVTVICKYREFCYFTGIKVQRRTLLTSKALIAGADQKQKTLALNKDGHAANLVFH